MRRVGKHPLWIGTARDARDIRAVLDAGIEAVVDLAMEEPPIHPTRELIYLRFPLTDDDGNPRWRLRMAMWAVEELVGGGVSTLVACGAGMSRSPAVVAVVMSQFKGTRPEDELEALRSGGPVDVSPGLWQTLAPAFYTYDRKGRPDGAPGNSQR
jgi:protein-tyrosine phosphatase